jgi:uncharacterized membrane protein
MKTAAPWKIWLVFAGVFLAGAIAGGFVSVRIVDRIVERGRAPGEFAPRLVNHLSERLELSTMQTEEIRGLVESAWQDLHRQRRASRETMQTLSQEISTVLTAEQRLEYAKIQENQRQRWQKMAGERRGPGLRRGGPSEEEGPPPRIPPPPPEE